MAREIKSEIGCQVCGEKDPIVLQFHHRDPSTKRFGIHGGKLGNYGWNTILKEIEKCDVLCANCHLRLHNGDK